MIWQATRTVSRGPAVCVQCQHCRRRPAPRCFYGVSGWDRLVDFREGNPCNGYPLEAMNPNGWCYGYQRSLWRWVTSWVFRSRPAEGT